MGTVTHGSCTLRLNLTHGSDWTCLIHSVLHYHHQQNWLLFQQTKWSWDPDWRLCGGQQWQQQSQVNYGSCGSTELLNWANYSILLASEWVHMGLCANRVIVTISAVTCHCDSSCRRALVPSVPERAFSTFHCNGMEGQYINVVIPGRNEYLTLCEVESYGAPLDWIWTLIRTYH